MKKTKKLISLILAIVVLICTLNFSVNVFANNTETFNLKFSMSHNSTIYSDEVHLYKFKLDSFSSLKIDFDSKSTDFDWGARQNIFIIKENTLNDYLVGKEVKMYLKAESSSSNEYNYWYDGQINLNSGIYYLIITGTPNWLIYMNYSVVVTPTVNKIKNLKSTTTNNSIKLTWTGDMGAVGYQVQKNTSDGYKTVKTTTGTSCTIKDLSSAYSYKYRVRGYTKVDGKTYYGSWSNITAITKPNKVSIKTPSTNSKHQIIAKWNKVTRATGYQVQYCKNKSCSSVIAIKTVSGQSKVSYTGKNFTKNKTYYVRVRAYKTVNNKKYYGAWSTVKSIKCK